MTRKSIYSILCIILLTILFLFTPLTRMTIIADAAPLSLPPWIVLTKYSKTMAVGEEFGLIAVASNGKQPTFKSSKSSIASVNTYGWITAKKAGTCKITAKIKNTIPGIKSKYKHNLLEPLGYKQDCQKRKLGIHTLSAK